MIVCLGWGSLIWRPGNLPIVNGWSVDGPALPVEFARQSMDGRITLVIVEDSARIPVLWTVLDVQSLYEARRALASRESGHEKVPSERFVKNAVGFWSQTASSQHRETHRIGAWAKARQFSGVVWTTLKPKFKCKYRKPSCDEVVEYLSCLKGEKVHGPEKYVRYAPQQIRTAYREVIERELGWTPKTYRV